MAFRQDWYTLLGVANDASPDAIEHAFEQRMHLAPDNNARVVLRHARQVLLDPASRAAYDVQLRQPQAARNERLNSPQAQEMGTDRAVVPGWIWPGVVLMVLLAGYGYSQRTSKVIEKPRSQAPAAMVQPNTQYPAVPPTDGAPQAGTSLRAGPEVGSPEAVYATAAPSVVVVEAQDGMGRAFSRGSGVAVGLQQVITNCHVIAQAAQIKVRQGGSDYAASALTSDTYFDLCLLQVPQLSAPTIRRGTVKNLRVGQVVYAIGTPQGLERTLSQGLVSAMRETSEGTVIQTSAPISPGSSGGGLFDTQGQLVGITTFQTKTGQNLNFAIPVDWLDTMRTR